MRQPKLQLVAAVVAALLVAACGTSQFSTVGPTPQPPAGNPGNPNPPAADQPGGQPPAANPPGGQPPAANPPGGQPPAANPPGGQPPAANPPGGQPGDQRQARLALEADLLRMGASVGDGAEGRVWVLAPDDATAARVRQLAAQKGVPLSLLDVWVGRVQPFSLQAFVRPLVGGLQIETRDNAGGGGNVVATCTLGYTATLGGNDGFVTASHCTTTFWASDTGTNRFFQPVGPAGSNRIADLPRTEIDPAGGACPLPPPAFPAGSQCRMSDAAFKRYDGGVTFNRGFIARPTGYNNPLLSLSPIDFRIVGKVANPAQVLQFRNLFKVGRTTGLTNIGKVVATNTTLPVPNQTNRFLLGQVVTVSAPGGAAGGDSGSPVFAPAVGPVLGTDVVLVGNLWGGAPSAGYLLVAISPIYGIEFDLGTLTVIP